MSQTDNRTGECNASEEFWDDLLDFIEKRKVVPVVGRELITVTVEGQEVPLYRAIAEKLLKKYGLAANKDVVLRPHQELNDAVVELSQRGKRVQELYRPINELLQRFMGQTQVASEALRILAGIRNFDLFITTTFDDVLVNTLDQVRGHGEKSSDRIIYAPNLTEKERRDLPERRASNYHAVFYLFGQASESPFYAIHDEDTLEFMYNLLTRNSAVPERMIGEVLSRNLLLIGCSFADWLSRFFIRLSNVKRLSSNERSTWEFLVGEEVSQDESLTIFLKRFSQNSRLYPCGARAFIKELAQRWDERHPLEKEEKPQQDQNQNIGEIFLSYSHADIVAAKTLYKELTKELGAEIIWFDKERLKPGDDWDTEIKAAITRCKIFIPLLSSNTQADVGGYLPKEWEAAMYRSKWFPGSKFKIIPVVLGREDDDKDNPFDWIPEDFRKNQFGNAPAGHMSDQLRGTIQNELRDLRRRR